MRITARQNIDTPSHRIRAGVQVDLDPRFALEYIQAGLAVAEGQVETPEQQRAPAETPEQQRAPAETPEQTQPPVEKRDYSRWTKAQLIAALADRGIAASESSKNSELAAQLEADDAK